MAVISLGYLISILIEEIILRYPLAVFFILINELFERFTFYGFRTILTMFFKYIMLYSENGTNLMIYFFSMINFFFPVVGAIIADSWLGKYRTIVYSYIVYAVGGVLVMFVSANYGRPLLSNSAQEPLIITGLILFAVGSGAMKPCVSSLGGDQYKLPEQNLQLEHFFAVFYFAINLGAILSAFVAPTFRNDINCFGDNSCYPLAFGIPTIFLAMSAGFASEYIFFWSTCALVFVSVSLVFFTVIFVGGKRFYVNKPPMENMIVRVGKCISNALWNRRKQKETSPRERWIDYADDETYDKELRDDAKYLLDVLVVFVPLPVFWALFNQQGSRWATQAERMDCDMGVLGNISPDQMQIANPIIVVTLIPIMQMICYPLLYRLNIIRTPLQRMTVGGIIAALSFFTSAIVQWQVESHLLAANQQTSHIRIFNLAQCGLRLKSDKFDSEVELTQMSMNPQLAMRPTEGTFKVTVSGPCVRTTDFVLASEAGDVRSFYFYLQNGTLTSSQVSPPADLAGDMPEGYLSVSLAYVFEGGGRHSIELRSGAVKRVLYTDGPFGSLHEKMELPVGRCSVSVDGGQVASGLWLGSYGAYTLLVTTFGGRIFQDDGEKGVWKRLPKSSVHIFWQLPQYFLISLSEVMVSVTGMEFSFTQAPSKMNTVLSSIWLLAAAFGDILDAALVQGNVIKSQVWEFVVFACLMLAVMVIFAFIAQRYKYREGSMKSEGEIRICKSCFRKQNAENEGDQPVQQDVK